jgi:hypothetical protein
MFICSNIIQDWLKVFAIIFTGNSVYFRSINKTFNHHVIKRNIQQNKVDKSDNIASLLSIHSFVAASVLNLNALSLKIIKNHRTTLTSISNAWETSLLRIRSTFNKKYTFSNLGKVFCDMKPFQHWLQLSYKTGHKNYQHKYTHKRNP